jgi:hypothetical protein
MMPLLLPGLDYRALVEQAPLRGLEPPGILRTVRTGLVADIDKFFKLRGNLRAAFRTLVRGCGH